MSDADLIYNACLRAERRLEQRVSDRQTQPSAADALGLLAEGAALLAIKTLREEIGNGLAKVAA